MTLVNTMKREKPRLRVSLGTALLASAVFITQNTANAANPPPAFTQPTQADDALLLTYRLLNESSAAKGVLASDNAEVKALHSKAMAFYQQAVKADARGEEETRDQALLQAKMTLFKAAQQTKKVPELNERGHSLYQRRVQSADALLDAHKRIREELKAGADVEALENRATANIAAANTHFEQDDLPAATRLIDQALNALKGSLISLRNGSTLVRTLHFDSPKEEYEYELGRNQSHTLLTDILLQEEPLPKNTKRHFDKEIKTAKKLRQQAETLAARGKYEMAIKTLKESTGHIVRAIRAARDHTSS